MKIGFIGMGNMASNIAIGLSTQNDCQNMLYYYDIANIHLDNQINIEQCDTMLQLVQKVDCIMLSIKPNVLHDVIEHIKDHVQNKMVVSMVAGFMYEHLKPLFHKDAKLLTIMPSIPVSVHAGVTLLEKQSSLNESEYTTITNLFNTLGSAVVVESNQFLKASAISGCGPAFVYMIIEAMADGGVLEGLPRQLSLELANLTLIGAASMQLHTNIHPGALKDAVCSPGGLTIKGVASLEDDGLRSAMINAIKACNE